ncbi:hypothetical protein, partial [Salmonella enterica]|uniref:hypothetical protein n=1 Tax=Salmonella enterica TaxID=28901 RepID=UPI003297BED8
MVESVCEQRKRVFGVLSESEANTAVTEHDGIVVGTDVHDRHFEEFAFRDGRSGLSGEEEFGRFARLNDVNAGTDGFEAA